MNLTLAKLKQLIKEEMVRESQKAWHTSWSRSQNRPEVLYSAALSF